MFVRSRAPVREALACIVGCLRSSRSCVYVIIVVYPLYIVCCMIEAVLPPRGGGAAVRSTTPAEGIIYPRLLMHSEPGVSVF